MSGRWEYDMDSEQLPIGLPSSLVFKGLWGFLTRIRLGMTLPMSCCLCGLCGHVQGCQRAMENPFPTGSRPVYWAFYLKYLTGIGDSVGSSSSLFSKLCWPQMFQSLICQIQSASSEAQHLCLHSTILLPVFVICVNGSSTFSVVIMRNLNHLFHLCVRPKPLRFLESHLLNTSCMYLILFHSISTTQSPSLSDFFFFNF